MMNRAFLRDLLLGCLVFGVVAPAAVAVAEQWTGNDNGNHRIGTPTRDEYYGRGGGDWLEGRGGNDSISGDSGNDVLLGGDDGGQFDYLNGGTDDDVVLGGFGDDRIFGQSGVDELQGEDGNDNAVAGGPGNDKIRGGSGNDRLFAYEASGSDPDPVVDGGADYDECTVNSNDNHTSCIPV